MSGVSVTGGSAGITANFDDLLALSTLLRTATAGLDDALDELDFPVLRHALGTGVWQDPAGTALLLEELRVLADLWGPVSLARWRADALAGRVDHALARYLTSERQASGIVDRVAHGVAELAGSSADGILGTADLLGGRPDLAERRYVDALPGLTDAAAPAAGLVEECFAGLVPDGHAVLHDLGTDDTLAAVTAPHSLADLLRGLALRNAGAPGDISVSFVVGADGRRRVIVDLPGTKSWNPVPGPDVTGVGTDVRALQERRTTYADGVLQAMRAAGVGPHEEVMVVGHSEGGLIAVEVARRAAGSGRFDVTHVVTAGSPIGQTVRRLPSSVQVLALENSSDLVPQTDGVANPDTPAVTTVTGSRSHTSVGADHDLDESYVPIAEDAERSGNASVDSYLAGIDHFLDGSALDTHVYRITRSG